tara:strand:- start:3587 stop:4087 length:501 start_codon:yes stop_codon:yes gene_type:complete
MKKEKQIIKENYKKFLINTDKSSEGVKMWWAFIDTQDKNLVKEVVESMTKIERRLRDFKDGFYYKTKIRKFANLKYWTDVEPYEVVRVISDKTVEVRLMDTIQTKRPEAFVVGGFAAHCIDNHNQDYKYISNDKNPTKRIRKGKKGWGNGKYQMSDYPFNFYDYNF